MSVQVIKQNGQPEWAVLPYKDYLELVEQAEMLDDIREYDAAMQAIASGTEELIPASVVFALADGANPIKTWREYRKLSQRQLAETVCISVPFLSQLETGKRKASLDVITGLASALQVDVDDLISK
jgi:predicted transcriptional regulator